MWKCLESSWWGGGWGVVGGVEQTTNHYHSSLSWVELNWVESWSIYIRYIRQKNATKITITEPFTALPHPAAFSRVSSLKTTIPVPTTQPAWECQKKRTKVVLGGWKRRGRSQRDRWGRSNGKEDKLEMLSELSIMIYYCFLGKKR